MKIVKIFLILILMILTGYGLYRIGLHQGTKNIDTVQDDKKNQDTETNILYWHDPMVPGHKFDKPGKSPFMDMELVPVYAEKKEISDGVKINARLQQNLGIRIAQVTEDLFDMNSEVIGDVAYDERNTVLIQARASGYLEKLIVRTVLEPVKKDQVLAEIFIPEWVAIQEEYLAIQRMNPASKDLLQAVQQRMKLVGMSEAHIQLIQSTNKVYPRLKITAPTDGIITELSVREGVTLNNGTPLFKMNSLKTVWVNAQIPESMIQDIKINDEVQATTATFADTEFKGKINAILPEINQNTRTLTARIELKNTDLQLLPGMFARIHFKSERSKKVLMIPTEAVIQTGQRTLVIVAENDNFIPVEISIGRELNNKTEILAGLILDQTIVVSGQFLIDSEASLKGIETRMLPLKTVVHAKKLTPKEMSPKEMSPKEMSPKEMSEQHGVSQ